jgi:hypothetical protein
VQVHAIGSSFFVIRKCGSAWLGFEPVMLLFNTA